jgi:glycosyltransferase involved in cell wall biosynthesis
VSRPPTVSVVTPVYNGEEYLAECIESVVRQTYTDWEYVIVDNASTDASGSIADRYAARDGRIRVQHESEFLHALENHNRTMRAVHPGSRYCKFLHADDWLYPECLERMVAVAEANPSVGVVSSYRLLGDRVEQQSPVAYTQTVMSGHHVVRWELIGPKGSAWVTGSQTSLLIRSDLIVGRGDFYDTSVWHADTDAAYRVLMESDFGFVHQLLTFTRRHTGALMSYSHRVWSFITRDGRLLMRYGPHVLSPRECRRELRAWLWRYTTWLGKQTLKPARHRQAEFHEFHQREIDYMLSEAGSDPEVRVALSVCRRLLHAADSAPQAAAGPAPPKRNHRSI